MDIQFPTMKARLTILGSGSSPGVPYLGCTCETCTSSDPRDTRTRQSALVEAEDVRILMDTSPDLRAQCLRTGLLHLDAVLFTHTHADHLYGLDDLRAFKFLGNPPIQCFAPPRVLRYIRNAYPYLFDDGPQYGGGKPLLEFHEITGPFTFRGIDITPFEVPHAPGVPSTVYRIGDTILYAPDCSALPEELIGQVRGIPVMVLDMVQMQPGHETHLTWDTARNYAERVKAALTVYTHCGHDISYARDSRRLRDAEVLAYDGMIVEVDSTNTPFVRMEE